MMWGSQHQSLSDCVYYAQVNEVARLYLVSLWWCRGLISGACRVSSWGLV